MTYYKCSFVKKTFKTILEDVRNANNCVISLNNINVTKLN